MKLADYIKENRREDWFTSRVLMNDGFSISIQASRYHYCQPRCNVDPDLYTEFELGYPSEIDSILDGMGEDENTVDTVFPYVPISVVNNLIDKHGGIKGPHKPNGED